MQMKSEASESNLTPLPPDTVPDGNVGLPAQDSEIARHPSLPTLPNINDNKQLLVGSHPPEEAESNSQDSVENLGAELINRRELRETLLGLNLSQTTEGTNEGKVIKPFEYPESDS